MRLLFVLGQHHVLPQETQGEEVWLLRQVDTVLETLRACEGYYDVLGGVAGYQLTALQLIHAHHGGRHEDAAWELEAHDGAAVLGSVFHVPTGPDLVADPGFAAASVAAGLHATPQLGELYPLGGAGDRLGLKDEATGEPLPAAMLPYNGHTLLECLLRDVVAREYLYYRLFGTQIRTPVAIMTSAAKGNHSHVMSLCEHNAWFCRGQDSFRLFQQPLVPVLKADAVGTWVLTAPGEPMLKPGGHGTIWKLAQDTGALDWLSSRGVSSLLVRQISNPLAGTDGTLLALGGVGTSGSKAFGFVSCARATGAAEGVNVLMERRVKLPGAAEAYDYHVSAMEYTEFARLGIPDVSCEFTGASFPANTNVMFASLAAVQAALATGPAGALPGMLMNLSKPTEAWGEPAPVRAGRLECSMQNLVDCMPAQREARRLTPPEWRDLSTFVLFTSRRRVTSSAKRQRSSDTDTRLAQTPEGSGLDYLRNAADMLAMGGSTVPPIASSEEYVRNGGRPGFLFRCHPALGPLWHVAAQKVRACDLRPGAELDLELSEADVSGLRLEGSLHVRATQPLGALADGVLAYSSSQCGRARLHNVSVVNAGVDWASPAVRRFWTGSVPLTECVKVTIHGDGEFDAEGVVLEGAHAFEVPAGHILTLRPHGDNSASPKHGFTATLAAKQRPGQPSWWWGHALQADGHVALTLMRSTPQ